MYDGSNSPWSDLLVYYSGRESLVRRLQFMWVMSGRCLAKMYLLLTSMLPKMMNQAFMTSTLVTIRIVVRSHAPRCEFRSMRYISGAYEQTTSSSITQGEAYAFFAGAASKSQIYPRMQQRWKDRRLDAETPTGTCTWHGNFTQNMR